MNDERDVVDSAMYEPGASRWPFKVALGAALLVPVLIKLRQTFLPPSSRSPELANRVKCGSNLRQIRQAVLQYAQANGGTLPLRLDDVATMDGLAPGTFVCPSSRDTPASNGNLSVGEHLSYVYVGGGLQLPLPKDVVLLYEPVSNHDRDGIHILFGNGDIEFFSTPLPRLNRGALGRRVVP